MINIEVSPSEAKALIDNGKAILIDVRELNEWQTAHIKGATFLPLSEYFAKVPPSYFAKWQGKIVIIYCRSGVRSLNFAKDLMAKHPSIEFCNLTGGIISWNAELNGYNIITSKTIDK